MMNDLKQLEGKEVYLRPKGNEASRHKLGEVIPATLIKVGRVFAWVSFGNRRPDEKLRCGGMYLDNGFNGGYTVYSSKQAALDSIESESLRGKIRATVTDYRFHRNKIPLKDLREIAKLLKVSTNE